jgi:hypothetical protein
MFVSVCSVTLATVAALIEVRRVSAFSVNYSPLQAAGDDLP